MIGQSKLELLLTLKNKIQTGLNDAKKKLGGAVDGMKNKLKELKASHVQAFSAMKEQIPGLENALQLLKNPYAIAIAATLALGVALYKCVDAAADFETGFVPLKNINLDKSKAQIDGLKQSILDTAFKTGISAADMTGAYADIQGGLNIFGKDVDLIAEKVGNFSLATGANLGDSVNSTVKAMKAFGFGAEKVEEYLISNAKAVQVGIASFDELAKVQTEYAGSAASAGQDFNVANKLFAAFTLTSKDANIAATMTKSAFQGLTMKPTIEGLKSIGLNMFDSTGKMKGFDKVISELVPKLNKMSDQEFLELRNAIGGPEGLQNLFNQLRTSGNDVLSTFKAFDETPFSISDALSNAKGDLNTMKTILGNQINNIMIRIGEGILPGIIKAFGFILDAVTGTFLELKSLYDQSQLLQDVFSVIGTVLKVAIVTPFVILSSYLKMAIGLVKILLGIINPVYNYIKAIIGGIWEVLKAVGSYIYDAIMPIWDSFMEKITTFGTVIQTFFSSIFQPIKNGIKGLIDFILDGIRKLLGKLSQLPGVGKILAKFSSGFNSYLKETKPTNEDLTPTSKPNGGGPTVAPDPNADGGIGKVVGETKQARVLNITIQALHKGDNKVVNEKGGAMTAQELERMMTEIFLRMIRNVEGSY